ncbi:MAG TPA: NAD(P)/FAD-dependent oxidoreductase [Gammaproteobacteria bacterium]|nr:NAD(P)/FAD-dependent oxidoreductase [Gammaproteobacteria bacterium]
MFTPSISRRRFLQSLSVAGLALLKQRFGRAAYSRGQVVVIGGGFGGATVAKYIREFDPWIEVTLVEPNSTYFTCPASNWVLAGLRSLNSISHHYRDLTRHGVKIIRDTVIAIEPDKREVRLKGGAILSYDRLVVSPGIDFRWESIEGYSASVVDQLPHAWKAGRQTNILRSQLLAMRDGGTVVITSPPDPYRCPPGPYERASLIAHYLKTHKPKSKVLILDAKTAFAKQELFTAGWQALYEFDTDNSLIEWVSGPDGQVNAVDVEKKAAIAGPLEEKYRADVLNVIPPQKAGQIAQSAGLTDHSGWCPVDYTTWESALQRGVHVIGDAAIQDPMPKSAYAASSQAKVCADAVVALLNDRTPGEPSWINTCYSLVGPQYGISIAEVFELNRKGGIQKVPGSGGLSPQDGNHELEAVYARSWYTNIVNDTFG